MNRAERLTPPGELLTDALHGFLTILDLLGLLMLSLYFLQMLLSATLPRPRRLYPADEALRFTFVVPALNEDAVIEATVRNLREVAPDARVAVIDDGSDDRTAELVERLTRNDAGVILLRRSAPEARQGKGKAMNWAVSQLLRDLRSASADLQKQVFVVVDADGRVTPGLLPEARRVLAHADVVAAQARVRIRQSPGKLGLKNVVGRMLEQQQDLEFFITRHIQLMRSWWHSAALCGNGQFMRASYVAAMFEAGQTPWPDVLLEDFGSAVEARLVNPRHRLVFLEEAVTQQGLPDLRRFSRQRARWTQGTMQCLPYLAQLWRRPVPVLARLDLSYFILGPWLSGIIVLSFLTQPLRWAMGTQGLVLDAKVSLIITVINLIIQLQWVARYQRENRLSLGRTAFTLASLPVYGFALFLSLPMAYRHYFMGRVTWDKSLRHAEPGHTEPGEGQPGELLTVGRGSD
ncbi:putative glycosyltransferase (putative) [Deinococcus marmoris]|uniref:Putative glycosyltransferase (Putative) n=1 Tax=Deinococcus marmoris TaxID=249408 RepID=A0A1U7NSH2_9DEIO|nr:putative glycosyltransferase (putative) [Deinococcus marmoris]